MKIILSIIVLTVTCSSLRAQKLEYSEIHWGLSDHVSKNLHIKEVLRFERLSQEELRDRTDRWLDYQLTKNQIVEWRMGEGSSKQSWFVAQGEPYDVDGLHRIWTKYLVCKDCIKLFKNSKSGIEGHYRIDFRFKEGKLLMVMSSFYSGNDNVKVEGWMVKDDKLNIDATDPRVAALEDYFVTVFNDLKTFIESCENQKSVDDW